MGPFEMDNVGDGYLMTEDEVREYVDCTEMQTEGVQTLSSRHMVHDP